MEEDSMINMPDDHHLVFDEKIGNKRVRDGEDETHKAPGRLEKRPSGIFGVTEGGDYIEDEGGKSGSGGGRIDTFISNVFQKNNKSTTTGSEGEVEVGGEVKTGVFDVVEDHQDKKEDLGVDGGGVRGGDGDGGIISSFFSNIFHNNGNGDGNGEQAKSDPLLNEDAEKTEYFSDAIGENGGSGEAEDLNAEKLAEKKDKAVDLPSKDPSAGNTLKSLKPDDYSERVFFLNNN